MSAVLDTLVLATHNVHKLAELRRVLEGEGVGVAVVGLDAFEAHPEPAETEDSFEGNALIKARAAAVRTGLPALADDSGLEVDALNRMPGVRSSRWSGPSATDESNLRLVLAQLDDVPDPRRTARFVCAMALVLPDGTEHVLRRTMEGRLAREPDGDHGFGYDPIFVTDGFDVTNGRLSPAQKDAVSHRGQAVRAMAAVLAGLRDRQASGT